MSEQNVNREQIPSTMLLGVYRFRGRTKPQCNMDVLWIWDAAGQIAAGDYYNGVARDASNNYAECNVPPTHWMPWPENWPGTPKTHQQKVR